MDKERLQTKLQIVLSRRHSMLESVSDREKEEFLLIDKEVRELEEQLRLLND